MSIKAGDTVKVLAHRNAYDEDISTWRSFPFNIGETFVVGVVQTNDHAYPCGIVFPVGEESEFWRSDDLELVASAQVPTQLERVRRYQNTMEISVFEAKRMVEREDLLAEIASIHTIDEIKAILTKLVTA